MKADFTRNLGRVYAIYTGGFAGFVLLLALLEQLGLPDRVIGYLFVFFTIFIYALIGFLSRTMQVSEYYVAGRRVPALSNGIATAADWLSAASFLALAGGLYHGGYSHLAFVIGWTGGYVLVAVLIAPYLRKFGAYTVPDFLGARYRSDFARLIGIVILFSCSFSYLLGQITGTGLIASRFLGIDFDVAVFVGLIAILLCSLLGGMRAVTWTQVAQYVVLIVAYLAPVVMLSIQQTGIPLPQLTYGAVLQEIQRLEASKPALEGVVPFLQTPQTFTEALNFFALALCLMIGTASLPHILMRFFTTPSVRDARRSVGWALLFIFVLYITAPAYAAYAKLEVYQNVLGSSLASIEAIAALPEWVFTYGALELVQICGADATTAQAVLNACQARGVSILSHGEFQLAGDTVVIAMPEIAGLPYVVAGLVAAGGLAAALSTADGLLLAIANALSHDVYYRTVDPSASTARRLAIARILLIAVAAAGALLVATGKLGNILDLVAFAFSLAAAGLFPALVMGVWSARTNKYGAVAGMAGGFLLTLFYILWTHPAVGAQPLWFGLDTTSAGLLGLFLAFALTYLVSRLTPAPSEEMQEFVRSVRVPRGGAMMHDRAG